METGRHRPLDEHSVAAAITGDAEAIDRIWQENRRWVAAVVLAHKPRTEELEDLLQEVAMTLVKKIGTLRDAANLRAWLRVVAINVARAAGRSSSRRPREQFDPEGWDGAAGSDPDHVGPRDLLRDTLDRIARLPEQYREPLMLRAMSGMRSRQIGDILDIPPATVDTRVARARRMLLEEARATEDSESDDAFADRRPVANGR